MTLEPLVLPTGGDAWLSWVDDRAVGQLLAADENSALKTASPGDSAILLVAEFLGRPYDDAAFQAWLNRRA